MDALAISRHVAALPPLARHLPCPDLGSTVQISVGPLPWGDADCNRVVDVVDALKILRHVAALPVTQTLPCPGIGTTVVVTNP